MLLWRFKKSVAFTANGNMDLTGLQREVDSLIQGVGDNFDQQNLFPKWKTPNSFHGFAYDSDR